ncbi:hypothetical protein [Proteiniclasticum ruminis]|uniref:hypothetical protein n=1 Tax=Proteiniclasticum ruminis TaxID=398199 RepID=UPI0028ADF134|nr:hypothetical protein [Proteiniclasticum ruminis]
MAKLFDFPEGTDYIKIRKQMSKILSKTRSLAKPSTCILCGNDQTSFCNSHSVPQLSLNNIADNGKLLHASALMGVEIIDIEKGVNNSGTFHFICNNCDSKFFQDYENEENLKSRPTDKVLAEIAVKNFLLQLSKRTHEVEIYKELQKQYKMYINPEEMAEINRLDIRDFNNEIQFHKTVVDSNITGGYQVLFWKVLPYRIPIAVQSVIALTKDLEGNIINYVSNISKDLSMRFMHIVVLPLKTESVILAFYHKRDKVYRNLRHQLNSVSDEKKLKYLNYLIFAHTENYFLSKTIKTEIDSNEKLSLLSTEYNGYPSFGVLGEHNSFGVGYEPIEIDDIPNFLSKEYSMK